MKNIFSIFGGILLTGAILTGVASCERVDYPDRVRLTEDAPAVHYVRYTTQDVFIDQAYMDEVVCIVGDNLTSVREVWFSDQQAIINTSFMTANTLILSVPASLPVENTDKMYLVWGSQRKDTLDVPFKVLPPAPAVNSMSNEWAKPGEKVTIYGNYFVEDEEHPIVVSFSGVEVPHNTISLSMTELSFPLPDGVSAGMVTVTTYSGTGRSKFVYMDTRNILFDWDGYYGYALGHGWRDGSKVLHHPGDDSFEALSGNYIVFTTELKGEAGADWPEDPMSFNYWPETSGDAYRELNTLPEFASYIDKYGVGGLVMKFECLIPESNPWKSCALQLMFSGNNDVTNPTATNAYFSDASLPRGLWMPWSGTGSFDTGGKWQTVTIPLSSFIYTHEGKDSGATLSKDRLTGLTFFVWNGGVNGEDCTPLIAIDNIRVVPAQ